jgi:Uma2 family endonuclease
MKTQTRKTSTSLASRNGHAGQPAWEVARLFPAQGQWTEADYFALDTNHFVELSDGFLEFPPMPSTFHQWIMLYLYRTLEAFAMPDLGLVLAAPLPVRLWRGKIREPDVLFMFHKNRARVQEPCWLGADLVMEVVSPGSEAHKRDLVEKKADYARGKVPEYWIVEPEKKQITVLWLKAKKYSVHGVFKNGKATSRLLPGFEVAVEEVFSQQY